MFRSRRTKKHDEPFDDGTLEEVEFQDGGYAVDLVLCIDVTSSMTSIIETVKRGALTFHVRLAKAMALKEKPVGSLRIRVVAFRDFKADRVDPVQVGGFWRLPAEVDAFRRFVSGLRASGGGDEPESGLEALALAIDSDWDREPERRRHVIVLFTDASAHPLGVGREATAYPAGMPEDLDALAARWGQGRSPSAVMDTGAKRLLIFAPDRDPWTGIATSWNNTLHSPSTAGTGLSTVEIDDVIGIIAGSV
ncbi:vWA domain-containing protein [Phytohabitans sp. ZYX-F-186]|uniref:VWA domain-containing protein n=1 Tax=Phytohabitans maris TaxID=3071409 RepID=A0ABU0ZG59_9ACTN|nr:vWA domain-containing protein [Phytohabitans sp. ZYX-F-186]MDQ7905379.1 vWA domain-containing protein [Phytohabitans sp. ZYX-F-186]